MFQKIGMVVLNQVGKLPQVVLVTKQWLTDLEKLPKLCAFDKTEKTSREGCEGNG